MKHLIFTITSMLFSIGVFSQQFDFYLNNSFENELYDAIETDSTFEFVGMKKLNGFYESYYLKLSKTGVFIKDTVLAATTERLFTGIKETNKGVVISEGGYYKGDGDVKIYYNYDFNSSISIKIDSAKHFYAESIKLLNDSSLALLGFYIDTSRFQNASFFNLNLNDTSYQFFDISDPQFLPPQYIFDIIEHNGKKLISTYNVIYKNPTVWYNSSEIIQLNDSFQIDTAFDISYSQNTFGNYQFNFFASLLSINQNHFMVSARGINARNASHAKPDDMAAIVMDTNYNEVSLNFYGLPDSSAKEANQNLSRYDSLPYVFIGGTENFIVRPGGFGPDTTLFMLTKADLLGNEIWTRYYSNNTNLFLRKVLATSDGGALIFGSSYDPAGPDGFEQDVWIVKVDSNGNYQTTGIADQQIPSTDFVFYPNPVVDEVHFRQVNQLRNYNLELFDISGKKVLERKLTSSDETINTANLNSGTFIYHLTDQKGNYASGKLIKK